MVNFTEAFYPFHSMKIKKKYLYKLKSRSRTAVILLEVNQ